MFSVLFGFQARALQCADLFIAESTLQISETYRTSLLGKADQWLKLVRTARMKSTIDFQLQVERRDDMSKNRMGIELGSSETLSRLQMEPADRRDASSIIPPSIDPSTMELLQDTRVETRILYERLQRDRYFEWLKHNSLRYQVSQKDDLKLTDRLLKSPPDQAQPVPLFISYRREGMSPDLALIRLMRNLDPVLSPSAVDAANSALFHSAIEAVLLEKVIPTLKTRNISGKRDAWTLMPTLSEGHQNLRKLLDEQSAKYGKFFPRAAYERVLILARKNEKPAFVVMSEYHSKRLSGVAEAKILTDLDPQLRALRTRLGLTDEFPLGRLYDIVDKIKSLHSTSSYEAILADIFEPPAGALIRELRFLTELAEGMSTPERADSYLRSLVEP